MRNAVTDSREMRALKLHHNVRFQGSESWRVALAPAHVMNASARQAVYPQAEAGRILEVLNTVKALWGTAPSDQQTVSIFCDALVFAGSLPPGVALPHVWFDECEIVFEWIGRGRHAIVSCEGDGVLGYAYRVDGTFRPGAIADATPHSLPVDLTDYLTTG